ncbi:T9SS type A sorting domain-containing protein [Marixanthomonas spongiae]|uniref:Secretion system C-terminal sorting domain-containing protein n=1 Tax=Marixanthomonas spongiae TaxID=2174845 RepID=A0A2U0I5F3_9FLAO|nr:T9SS type A sorting domain-containing protein [Marixanthomonas spongiae]PVW16341.1 hypothetical protein DDV96_03525 [Marixanthomonas spongiae]
MDASGNITWENNYGGSDSDSLRDIEPTSDGGYIATGFTLSNDGDVSGNHGAEDYWVIKLSATGVLQWQKTLGGSSEDQSHNVGQASDGGYFITGFSSSNDGDVTNNHGMKDIWVVKLNATGSIIWQKTYGGSNEDWGYGALHTSDGVNVIVGASASLDGDVGGNYGESDTWIVRLDNSGALLWEKNMGGSLSEYGEAIGLTNDGGYIVASEARSNDGDVSGNHGDSDYWAVKLKTDPLNVADFKEQTVAIYPNPAKDYISFQLPQNTDYSVEITNILGQQLYKGEVNQLQTKILLPTEMSTGSYFVTLFNKSVREGTTIKLLVE